MAGSTAFEEGGEVGGQMFGGDQQTCNSGITFHLIFALSDSS